jgi:tape measure domain-containing protein
MAGQEIKAGRAVVEVSLRDRVGKGLVAIERKLAQTGRNIATLGAALAGGGLAAVAWPLKLAADMEQTATSFEVMTGSAERGKALLEDLKKFAASTPFGFTELADNAKMLLAYGVATENVTGTLRLLGDVSGGNAERLGRLTLAYGQVQAKGRLMGQEVLQMVENGFNPLQEISRTTGESMLSLSKRMEAGGISAGEVTRAFITATSSGGRFAGLMERQASTGAGLFAQILDNATFALTDFGLQLLEALKPGLQFVLRVSQAMRGFITANSGVLKIMGLVAVGIVAVGGLLLGLGLGALALSTIVGGLATAWGFFVGALGFIFSPLGAVLALLTLAGVVAFNFRSQIAEALSGIAAYFAPVGAAIGRVYAIFATTFSGILGALSGGQLQEAAGIAWLGFVAAAWQGIAELETAIRAGLDYFGAWIPGIDVVRDYLRSAFGAIGQSILAGRWDLAGQIAMLKLQNVLSSGLDGLRGMWAATMTGLGAMWDFLVYGIAQGWNYVVGGWNTGVLAIKTGINGIVNSIDYLITSLKIAEREASSAMGDKFAGGMADQYRKEYAERKALRDKDLAEQQKANAQAFNQRSNTNANNLNQSLMGRVQAEQQVMQGNQQRRSQRQQQIAGLESQAAQAYDQAGRPTIGGRAADARAALDAAVKQAETERNAAPAADKFKPNLPSLAAGAGQQMKVESKGTFSAAAATLFGLGGSDQPQQQTAANTKRIANGINQLNDKLGAGATV